MASGDDLKDKLKGGGGSSGDGLDAIKSKESKSGSGSIQHTGGLAKGTNPDEIDLDEFEEGSGEMADAEEEMGYSFPLFIMDEGGSDTGKSSDYAHPDFPRPIGDEKTYIITSSDETKTGILNRYGEVPEYVEIFNAGRRYDKNDPHTATIALAAAAKKLDQLIEDGDACNVILDDFERWYEEVIVDKCRDDYDVNPQVYPTESWTMQYWQDRNGYAEMLVSKVKAAANHLYVLSGYPQDIEEDTRKVDGVVRTVQDIEHGKWYKRFVKPSEVRLLREANEAVDDEDTDEAILRTITVEGSKAEQVFPEGVRTSVNDIGVAKFWKEQEED